MSIEASAKFIPYNSGVYMFVSAYSVPVDSPRRLNCKSDAVPTSRKSPVWAPSLPGRQTQAVSSLAPVVSAKPPRLTCRPSSCIEYGQRPFALQITSFAKSCARYRRSMPSIESLRPSRVNFFMGKSCLSRGACRDKLQDALRFPAT
jgi:hypothetical protein